MSKSAGKAKRKGTQRFESAAFFDLDRTLLGGASGPVFAEALRAAGVLPERRNPLEPWLFRIFDLVGENYPTMILTREGARATRGWKVEAVAAAAREAVPALVERIQPYALLEMEEHRAAGRAVVLATTTPADWVRPLADALGIDHVIATRYGHDGDRYDGTIMGHFVWGRGKALAAEEWARSADVDLTTSYAYSDSYYDVPLLGSVGHPFAVNPDPRLAAVALLRRWPIRWLDAPPGVPRFAGLEPQQVALALARPELLPFARFRVYGARRIPESGPALIVANHRSYFDPLAIGVALGKRGRPVRFLGKKEVFDAPLVGEIATAMGGIRVDRGTGSEAPLRAAEEALRAGELVAMMPQGTIPRGREFFEPTLKGRWGAARLAAATGVPVVPIGLWGTEQVWPRSSRVPNLTNLTSPPTVTVRVGRPFHLTSTDPDEATVEIMDRIVAQLPPEARAAHEPTDEELRRTLPPGFDPDAASEEGERRPGHD